MGGEIFPDSSSALPNSAGRRPETGPSSLRSRTTGAAQIASEAAAVRDQLGYGGITVWEREGEPVSLADVTRQVAGMVRVGPVYTPSELRGYGVRDRHDRRGFPQARATVKTLPRWLDSGRHR